jgi:hypothetical protein
MRKPARLAPAQSKPGRGDTPPRDRSVHGQGGGLGLKIETRHTREPGVWVSGEKGYPVVVGSILSRVGVLSRRESPPRTCNEEREDP